MLGLWRTMTYDKLGTIIGCLEELERLGALHEGHNSTYFRQVLHPHQLLEMAQQLANKDAFWYTVPETWPPMDGDLDAARMLFEIGVLTEDERMQPHRRDTLRQTLRFTLTLCDQSIRSIEELPDQYLGEHA